MLACTTTNRWVVRTADGDQYDEAFGDYEKMVPLDNSGRYPDGVVQVVSFSRGLTRNETRECVRDGRAEAERIRAAERLAAPQEPTMMIDWWGAEEAVPSAWLGGAWRRLREKQVVQRPSGEVGAGDDTPPDRERRSRRRPASVMPVSGVECEGELWLAGYELAVKVDMGALCVQRGSRGLHHVRAGQFVCVELVRARETPAGELLRERLDGAEPGRREDARAPMSTEEEDLRTLWIDRDDLGQRFKEWKKVCSESTEEGQADSSVAGPPSCLKVCTQMQHHGGSPKL